MYNQSIVNNGVYVHPFRVSIIYLSGKVDITVIDVSCHYFYN